MSKRKWILFLIMASVILVALVLLFIFLAGGPAGRNATRFVKAELYVNGEKAEKPAVIW